MLGGAGHLSLEGGEVGGDAGDVEVDDSGLAGFAEEEGAVGVGVHEEVFGEDGGAGGVAEEVRGNFVDVVYFWPSRKGLPGRFGYSRG